MRISLPGHSAGAREGETAPWWEPGDLSGGPALILDEREPASAVESAGAGGAIRKSGTAEARVDATEADPGAVQDPVATQPTRFEPASTKAEAAAAGESAAANPTAAKAHVDAPEADNSQASAQTSSSDHHRWKRPTKDKPDTTGAHARASALPLDTRGFLAPRGAMLVVLVPGAIACVVGFVLSGATSIPGATGWGLAIGAFAAATLVRLPDAWAAIWAAPIAMFLITSVLGQVTLLGASITMPREAAMILTALAGSAPSQVIAVAGAAVICTLRRRAARVS